MIKHKEASNHTKWEKNLHFISTCTQQYSSTLAWWHTEIKQKPTTWALKEKKFLLTSDWGLRPVSSKLEDQLVTVWSDLHDVASSSHSYKRTMCDKTAEPIELLCCAVRGSVPLGWGESKNWGDSEHWALYEMLFFPGRHVVLQSNTQLQTGGHIPPGFHEHTCMHTQVS